MKLNKRILGVISFIPILMLHGCGGGGGGGGIAVPGGLTYTGLTIPATIDENNAVDLATGAYMGYSSGTGIGPLSAQSGEGVPVDQSITL